MRGFSKVQDDLLEDDEDQRKSLAAKAQALYEAAESQYSCGGGGSSSETLKLFQTAEAAMGPLLSGGLSSLPPEELKFVLKGRLHQAVLMAGLPDYTGRWASVKALVEEVLQFDWVNCHARWLRGLCLLRGEKRVTEALEEMKKAVQCAWQQGKEQEAAAWEEEIRRALQQPDGEAPGEPVGRIEELPEAEEPTSPSRTGSAKEGQDKDVVLTEEAVDGRTAARVAGARGSSEGGAAIQKGFFNRPSRKAASARSSGASSSASSAAKGTTVPSVSAGAAAERTSGPQEAAHVPAARETAPPVEKQAMEAQQKQIEELRQQLSQERDQRALERRRLDAWQEELRQCSEAMGSELEAALEGDRQGVSEALLACVGELRGQLQASRLWSEAEHQRCMDLSTELATLRELSARELRERQDTSRQQVAEVRELVGRIGELKAAAKTFRERAKKQRASAGAEFDEDLQLLADSVADFHALPSAAKMTAMVDDPAVLCLMASALLLGMLFALGVFEESFGWMRCRFVCAH